ncbi:hypothetical protein [Roseateles sp.]|uniref:hypothetical protein n=1 Tax=Roseateles sp. TaxID=1971397 RepID=UPI0025F70562|nr:hypothetical protein [Roseateles sp.]MBV8035538.1 hypothetical protein [Roseateles sp.]
MDVDIKLAWTQLKRDLAAAPSSQTELSLAAGVSQSAVSRILKGCPQRNGRAFSRLCNYASMKAATAGPLKMGPEVERLISGAVEEVWNGTPEHARAIAAIIRVAGAVGRASRR